LDGWGEGSADIVGSGVAGVGATEGPLEKMPVGVLVGWSVGLSVGAPVGGFVAVTTG
jgi:hypothetical protein